MNVVYITNNPYRPKLIIIFDTYRQVIIQKRELMSKAERDELCDKVIDAVDNDPLTTQGIKKALTKIKN